MAKENQMLVNMCNVVSCPSHKPVVPGFLRAKTSTRSRSAICLIMLLSLCWVSTQESLEYPERSPFMELEMLIKRLKKLNKQANHEKSGAFSFIPKTVSNFEDDRIISIV